MNNISLFEIIGFSVDSSECVLYYLGLPRVDNLLFHESAKLSPCFQHCVAVLIIIALVCLRSQGKLIKTMYERDSRKKLARSKSEILQNPMSLTTLTLSINLKDRRSWRNLKRSIKENLKSLTIHWMTRVMSNCCSSERIDGTLL